MDGHVKVLDKIRSVMEVQEFNPPANPQLINIVEKELGVVFPEWLREVYLACNGFSGPTGVGYLVDLEGECGVLDFTKFMRREEWWPDWLKRAIIFSNNGLGGSCTVHWCSLDGNLIEWCYGDPENYVVLEPDLYKLWKREQQMWDSLDG